MKCSFALIWICTEECEFLDLVDFKFGVQHSQWKLSYGKSRKPASRACPPVPSTTEAIRPVLGTLLFCIIVACVYQCVSSTLESHVEKEWTGSGLTNAKKEGMNRSEKRWDGGRVILYRCEGDLEGRNARVLASACATFLQKENEGGNWRIGRMRFLKWLGKLCKWDVFVGPNKISKTRWSCS